MSYDNKTWSYGSPDFCPHPWKKSGWNISMIAKIIRDERYAGDLVSGKMAYESFDSKHQVRVDKADWIVVKDNHEEFEKANVNIRNVVQGKKKILPIKAIIPLLSVHTADCGCVLERRRIIT